MKNKMYFVFGILDLFLMYLILVNVFKKNQYKNLIY